MIKFSLLAAAMLLAVPAAAQTGPVDAYDDGDWWLIKPPSGDLIILSNVHGKRTGDVVELELFGFFRTQRKDNVIALRARSPVDCAAMTGDMWVVTTFYSDRAPVEAEGERAGMQPFVGAAPTYDFACTDDRTGMRHFTSRSRKAVIEQILRELPAD